MKKIQLLIFILLFIGFSCKKNDKKIIDELDVRSICLTSEEELLDDTILFKSVNVIPLETNESSLIQKVSKIMFDEDKVFIFDKGLSSLFVFDLHGKHLNTIRKVGTGPGEYVQLTTVCLDAQNKQLILYSDIPSKLLFLDYAGNFIREQKIDGLYKEIVSEGNEIYLINYVPGLKNEYCYLYRINRDGMDRECLLDIPDLPQCDLYAFGNYMTNPWNINFSVRFDNSIYSIKDGIVCVKYRVDFGKYNFPDHFKKKSVSPEELQAACFSNQYIYSIVEISETENFLFFNTNLPEIYVYSKEENVLKSYSSLYNTTYDFYYNKMFSIENTVNTLSFLVDMDDLFRLKASRDKSEKLYKENFSRFIENLIPDDNPILMICELK